MSGLSDSSSRPLSGNHRELEGCGSMSLPSGEGLPHSSSRPLSGNRREFDGHRSIGHVLEESGLDPRSSMDAVFERTDHTLAEDDTELPAQVPTLDHPRAPARELQRALIPNAAAVEAAPMSEDHPFIRFLDPEELVPVDRTYIAINNTADIGQDVTPLVHAIEHAQKTLLPDELARVFVLEATACGNGSRAFKPLADYALAISKNEGKAPNLHALQSELAGTASVIVIGGAVDARSPLSPMGSALSRRGMSFVDYLFVSVSLRS